MKHWPAVCPVSSVKPADALKNSLAVELLLLLTLRCFARNWSVLPNRDVRLSHRQLYPRAYLPSFAPIPNPGFRLQSINTMQYWTGQESNFMNPDPKLAYDRWHERIDSVAEHNEPSRSHDIRRPSPRIQDNLRGNLLGVGCGRFQAARASRTVLANVHHSEGLAVLSNVPQSQSPSLWECGHPRPLLVNRTFFQILGAEPN